MGFEKHLKNIPVFETERLVLRKLTLSDLDDVYAFCSNPKVAHPMTWEVNDSKEMTNEFLQSVIAGYAKGESAEWAIQWKETGKVIGIVSFLDWSNKHKCLEIGYFLSEDYWGRGIAPEALKNLITYGFHELDCNRIEGRCDTDNIGSQKVMKKLGMRYEGTLRKNEWIKGEFRDTQMYSILASEFSKLSFVL
ncbi:ribosomal-protein-alanine N-acetyltransferase [Halobacillus dabanensis]|uniref:Ribosomal-protein-alanine N-acetyltransferase n=1 Tax=Halobacillus dabanensis TaxID=240302 RepID=A0A1I3YQ05_HALDA|nr:GNAT family protein [Halobacillus dabanensis]SFK33286.1 ribosomal-protein-alanine N-acetyltransferase [Halobacillus dabanensis]